MEHTDPQVHGIIESQRKIYTNGEDFWFFIFYQRDSKVGAEGKSSNVSNRMLEKSWELVFPNAQTEGKQ